LLKPDGYNPCPLPGVPVPVPGYRRVNGYTGYGFEKDRSSFFWKKTHLYPYPFTRRSCTRLPYIIQILLKQQKKKNEYPCPSTRTHTRASYPYLWYPCTRPQVPETGTGMKRVGYGFEKKNRLPTVPVPALPAAHRGCARPVPAVPVSKCLHRIHSSGLFPISFPYYYINDLDTK
jgi:hypothetical protein